MQEVKVKLIFNGNISFDNKKKTYLVKKMPARIKIIPKGSDFFPDGWCLIRGRIRRNGKKLRAKLIVNNHEYSIPISCRGTIQELIKIPPKTKFLFFEPMNSQGEFEFVENLTIKKIGTIERTYRMLKRVFFFLNKSYEQKRKILGLSYLTPLINLRRAYDLANKIRDCYSDLEYSEWIKLYDRLSRDDIKKIINDLRSKDPRINFVILIQNSDHIDLENTLKSIKSQLYRAFQVNVLEDLKKLNLKEQFDLKNADKTYFIFLKSGTLLSPHSLYWIAKEASLSNADLIYADHDYLTSENKRISPYFKPDFSIEYLRSTNYIKSAFAIKAELILNTDILNLGEILKDNLHSMLLRVAEKTKKFSHIPAILFHLKKESSNENDSSDINDPVKEHLERLNISASVEKFDSRNYKIIYHVKNNSLISIIIPTKNHYSILKKCIDSILQKTSYPDFEILLVDNQSFELDAVEYLRYLNCIPRIKVLRYNKPYNFSAINNFAVTQAKGDILLFLNNDTEIITPQWLEIMLGCLQQPDVGAVGVKLYYPNGKIQHAGVVIGVGGCADHAFKYFCKEERGYMDRAILQQEYLAVTAACMMTWKKLFIQLGGFDEENLPVSFNDVDYCLKLKNLGYRIIFTPYVELYHHESLSRGRDFLPETSTRSKREADFIRNKWRKYIEYDPFYNPNLNYKRPDFTLNSFPIIKKPWENGSRF